MIHWAISIDDENVKGLFHTKIIPIKNFGIFILFQTNFRTKIFLRFNRVKYFHAK